jgi:uncharacterized protein YbaA (DUF1428 family)
MPYVDGFVIPVPKRKLREYRRMAQRCAKVWRELGALEYREWVAEDAPMGARTSFPRSVKMARNETVVFAWIVYKSRAHRDAVNKKAIADPRLADMADPKNVPFDGKRMIYGGFTPLVAM